MDRCNCICDLCANLCEESRVAIVSRKNEIPSETYVVLTAVQEKTSRYEEFSLMILKINNNPAIFFSRVPVKSSTFVRLAVRRNENSIRNSERYFSAELSNHDNIVFILNCKNNILFGPSFLHSAVRNLFLLHGCKKSFLLFHRFRKKKEKKKEKR